MGRIGASLGGAELRLCNRLEQAGVQATLETLHMARGEKLNSAKVDPRALDQLSGYQEQFLVAQRTMKNVTAANNMVSQSLLKFDEIRSQLELIQTNLLADED